MPRTNMRKSAPKAPGKIEKSVGKKSATAPKKIVSPYVASSESTTLLRAYGEQCFWVHEGPILADLSELLDALQKQGISVEQWKHHTAGGRNDFATWIEDVFRNRELAQNLRGAKTRSEAALILRQALLKKKSF